MQSQQRDIAQGTTGSGKEACQERILTLQGPRENASCKSCKVQQRMPKQSTPAPTRSPLLQSTPGRPRAAESGSMELETAHNPKRKFRCRSRTSKRSVPE